MKWPDSQPSELYVLEKLTESMDTINNSAAKRQKVGKKCLPGIKECMKLIIWLAKAKCLEVIDFRPDTWKGTKGK